MLSTMMPRSQAYLRPPTGNIKYIGIRPCMPIYPVLRQPRFSSCTAREEARHSRHYHRSTGVSMQMKLNSRTRLHYSRRKAAFASTFRSIPTTNPPLNSILNTKTTVTYIFTLPQINQHNPTEWPILIRVAKSVRRHGVNVSISITTLTEYHKHDSRPHTNRPITHTHTPIESC